ncbi:MAG: hypothetical protein JST40_07065 [Armatimonadetes bacterium]|nr:hypothetical protein [Armatimonadota bacterium]
MLTAAVLALVSAPVFFPRHAILGQPLGQMDMVSKYEIADPNRLAITPLIDGRFDPEEWDTVHASADAPIYMQWEPGHLYFGAQIPAGKDLVFSLDLAGDGWLVGSDNVEIRAMWDNGAPKLIARILDADNRNAPVWVSTPYTEMTTRSAGVMGEGSWTLEFDLNSPDLPQAILGRSIGLRTDILSPGGQTNEAYMPRSTSLVALRYERSKGLPSGMEWAPEYKVRTVTPGDAIKIRLNFINHDGAEPKRVELRTEGYGKDVTNVLAMPFPQFDKKKRAFVDYETPVAGEARKGYRVLNANITGTPDINTIIETSYSIADLLEIESKLPVFLPFTTDSRAVGGDVFLRSNTPKKISGEFKAEAPIDWTVKRNKEKKVIIYHSRGVMKIPVEFIVPQAAKGLIPIKLSVKVGQESVEKTVYIVIR